MPGLAKPTDRLILAAILSLASLAPVAVLAHGDVAPQAVDTTGLPEIAADDWATVNPYRADTAGDEVFAKAVAIGASGYNQNCARCHGLEAISGGLAPDLRYLEAEEYGDEWFVERFREGYTQDGVTKMPAFGELLGPAAGWAIRSYIESRPDDGQVTELAPELSKIRDELKAAADGGSADSAALATRLTEIGGGIETLSGAPVSDNIAIRAAHVLETRPDAYGEAAEVLTIGLSAAH